MFPVTAFYKGESQEKKHLRRLEGAKVFAVLSSPSYVERLWGFLSSQIHLVIVTMPSASDANKQCGGEVPTMVLSEARGL